MSDDKVDMIYDTLVDFRDTSRDRMSRIEDDLRDHKEGVIQNRSRIEKLEEPVKALGQIKRWSLWVAALAAGLTGLAKVLEWI
jgi:hypothetical protein